MIFPPKLQSGSKVAIVAPAGKLGKGSLAQALKILESWSLEVEIADHVFDEHGYFSSNDDNRLADIQAAFNDPSISAIWCARGGYGVTRILDRIDIEQQRVSPKWLIGFSDITALHLKLVKTKIAGIHGDVCTTLGRDQGALAAHYDLLFHGKNTINAGEIHRKGSTKAEIIGGNLSLLADSLGTSNELSTKGKILFLEDIGEPTYRVDRMLHQLYRAGKLDALAGLVVGHFTDITDSSTAFGQTWQEAIKHLVRDFDYPVVFSCPIGHEPNNYPLVVGGKYHLEAREPNAFLELIH